MKSFETFAAASGLPRAPARALHCRAAGADEGSDGLPELLDRACRAAVAAGRFEAVARLVPLAAKLAKGRPAAPASGPHPWEQFRGKFT